MVGLRILHVLPAVVFPTSRHSSTSSGPKSLWPAKLATDNIRKNRMSALYYYYYYYYYHHHHHHHHHILRAARFRALASSISHPQIFQSPANLFHAAVPSSFLELLAPHISTCLLASLLADYHIFSF